MKLSVLLLLALSPSIVFAQSELPEHSMISNGGFESELADWVTCSGSGGTKTITEDSTTGQQTLLIDDGACLYQEIEVVENETYQLHCEARGQGYTSLSLTIMNQSYQTLEKSVIKISGNESISYHTDVRSPEGSKIGAVTLYSENPAIFDNCYVVIQENNAVNNFSNDISLLVNGDFEPTLSDWNSCSGTEGTKEIVTDAKVGEKALQIADGGCLYQEFPVTENAPYSLQCYSKSDGYTSITLTMMNKGYNKLDSNSVNVSSSDYRVYTATITAPQDGTIGAVTLYSEGRGQFDNCLVTSNR